MENPDILIAKEQLDHQPIVIAIVKDGEILFTSVNKGIQPFFEALEKIPLERFRGCSIADRVVGKAALMLAAYLEAINVYTPLASQHAINIALDLNLSLIYDKSVDFIINRSQDGMCPMEKAVLDIDDPNEAFEILENKLQKLRT